MEFLNADQCVAIVQKINEVREASKIANKAKSDLAELTGGIKSPRQAETFALAHMTRNEAGVQAALEKAKVSPDDDE